MAVRPDPLPELLEPFLSQPERAGVITDFDGTLAPIVADPKASRPFAGATDALRRLARVYRCVAIVSGRPAGFLLDRFGSDGLVLSGLYGLELVRNGRIEVDPSAEPWRAIVDGAARAAEAQAPDGVGIERKGLSVVLHVRTAPEFAGWVETWVTSEAAVTGLAVHPARMSWELRPPVGRDKGTVVGELAAGLDAACFIGDDVGDLPAFDALDRMVADGARGLKVAVRSPEAPPEMLARADLIVDGPPGVVELLERLNAASR
jgi:trehalose 6-phosphate phosphatase